MMATADRLMLSIPRKHIAILDALATDAQLSKSGYVRFMIERLALEKTGMTYDVLFDHLRLVNDGSLPFKSKLSE